MDTDQETAKDLQDPGALPPLDLEGSDKEPEVKPDPGLSEGLPKGLKQTPIDDENHPRFKQVYRKMKDHERELEVAKAKLSEQAKDIELARMEFQNLIKSATEKKETSPEDDQKITQEVHSIQERLRALKVTKLEARKNLDFDREFYLDEQIEEQKEKLADIKRGITRKQIEDTVEDKTQRNTVNSDVARWVAETEWFDPGTPSTPNSKYNPIMAGAAKELDLYYANHPDWKGKPLSVRLAKIREQVEDKFNYGNKLASKDNKSDIPIVEGIGKVIPPGKSGPVQLTDEQRRVARMFHPELAGEEAEKAYAQSLKIIQSRR